MKIRIQGKTISWRHFVEACCVSHLLFFTISVSADGLSQDDIIRAGGAAGVLRTIGEYPGEYSRAGHTVTTLSDGSVFVYGAISGGSLKEAGTFNFDRKDRSERSHSLSPEAISWDPKLRIWKKQGRPPECPHTNYLHTATLLAGNKILFAGGICDGPRLVNDDRPLPDAYNKLSIWNGTLQKWEGAPTLVEARLHHTATLLSDGKVLFTGGESDTRTSETVEPVLDSVEIFHEASENRAAEEVQLPRLHFARARHTATRMADGRVMVAGGIDKDGKPMASVEIWDPATQAWRDGPLLKTPRYNHTASLLNDGSLMIAGGISLNDEPTGSVEIWNPEKGSWAEASPFLFPLRTHSATVLSNGDVLVIGTHLDKYRTTVSRSMLWNQSIASWQPAGALTPDGLTGVIYHLAPLKDGGALVSGNKNILRWSPGSQGTSEYVPVSGRSGHATALLNDGRLLLAGGRIDHNPSDLAEIFDPSTNRFALTGRMIQARYTGMPYQAALSSVVTNDGKVVIAGGWVRDIKSTSKDAVANYAEVWDPATGQWSIIKELHFEPQDRVYFGKLEDGNVLFFASRELAEEGPVGFSAWIWNPRTNIVVTKQVTATARAKAAIAILKDGRVLIVGGETREFVPGYRCAKQESVAPRVNTPTGVSTNTNSPPDDSDGCQDEPASWAAYGIATAEIWDSRKGSKSALPYPPSWHAANPQTMVLKNGNVLIAETASPSPYGRARVAPLMLWNAQNGTWVQLPGLPIDSNWPMTELSDGGIIAWAPETINPTYAHWLKPGAESWVDVLRFPQEKATVTQLTSGQLLALSFSAPYAAQFSEKTQQWQFPLQAQTRNYLKVHAPALVELKDGRLAVFGGYRGKTIVQIWNPNDDLWTISGNALDRVKIAETARLPSGAVLLLSYGQAMGSLLCNIWHLDSDGLKSCGHFTSQDNQPHPVALDSLEDGRIVFMTESDKAFVLNEGSNEWSSMKVEWNVELYRHGEAIRADKPFARLFDPDKKEWLDASVVAGKYYSMHRSGPDAISHPDMLWDPVKKRWAYIIDNFMGKNGFWLPDGCAISGPPFKIYNPTTGKVTDHPEIVTEIASNNMRALANGTVVLAGNLSDSDLGDGFFHRKATCAGFEASSDDDISMPGTFTSVASLQPEAKPLPPPSKASAPRWTRIVDLIEEFKWIALAVLIPLALYRPIRYVVNWT